MPNLQKSEVKVPWKQLYSTWRAKLNISPKVKDDYSKIMFEAVRQSVNADSTIKKALLDFIRPYAFSEYKSASSYKHASIIPGTFIQWLSEKKNKTISKSDLISPKLTMQDAILFSEEYTEGPFSQSIAKSYLIKFGKYLVISGILKTYPFGGLKVDMPRSRRVIVYNELKLDDFYNVILFGSEEYYTLFFKLMLQTGLRPLHAYYLTCGDIEYDKPQQDALGRTFYPIFARNMLQREKTKIKETVFKKVPPDVAYISESLKNEIVKWCEKNRLTGSNYVFKDFIELGRYPDYIRKRRMNPKISSRLKSKETKYIWYGLRDTWTSVIWAITNNVGDLIDLGGWAGSNIPLTRYRVSMKSCEALTIAKKYQIYLPPDRRDEILDLQTRCELGEEKTGAPAISVQEFETMKAMVAQLSKQIEELTKERQR